MDGGHSLGSIAAPDATSTSLPAGEYVKYVYGVACAYAAGAKEVLYGAAVGVWAAVLHSMTTVAGFALLPVDLWRDVAMGLPEPVQVI